MTSILHLVRKEVANLLPGNLCVESISVVICCETEVEADGWNSPGK